ncbi:hypothetical protein WJ64_32665 [Burkholderia ubonensis]|nr:hypothetical protein WJ64_32665 [Burkholderia ubonensis]
MPDAFFSARHRMTVNDMLLSRYQLRVEHVMPAPGSIAARFVVHWQRLQQVAFLLACQRLRGALARQAAFSRLPEWARQFAGLSISSPMVATRSVAPSLEMLMIEGYRQLMAWGSELPLVLAQRVPLLFPPEVDALSNSGRHCAPDVFLLTLAIQHAQRNPDSPRFVGA